MPIVHHEAAHPSFHQSTGSKPQVMQSGTNANRMPIAGSRESTTREKVCVLPVLNNTLLPHKEDSWLDIGFDCGMVHQLRRREYN
ncbi:hypothetical protein Pmar_PMAR009959 [Perkinsus marinus ATCC 50983]|uniref:Uncharacterized protein n=1 Tax=Perkinsus marinus (strain ATCC 50983 / TXsc) TaxID=423536 RepID=C5L2Q3_PERM5|nr:hypothetical protein Pmar_PMAR009959 [Perkinsus marinus ATCC 50983]EER08968.1 hypothetical protein Pmar_PMAR009959 [Perkinsus marinus ATCC 50983]|eukprot:XP_002777152.1 hypothetical protein Pmar_PMAR009959 [Perkinsus marinus ATCC 50983]